MIFEVRHSNLSQMEVLFHSLARWWKAMFTAIQSITAHNYTNETTLNNLELERWKGSFNCWWGSYAAIRTFSFLKYTLNFDHIFQWGGIPGCTVADTDNLSPIHPAPISWFWHDENLILSITMINFIGYIWKYHHIIHSRLCFWIVGDA